MRKKCECCGKLRLLKFFNKKTGDKLQSYCRDCKKAINKAHYYSNKEMHLEKNRRRRQNLREFINRIKSKPCQDCGVSYPPYVMDFDHRENKSFMIANSWRERSIKVVLAEIEKCDVVCANCHRQRTYNRKQTVSTYEN
jgi:hypothetical protein